MPENWFTSQIDLAESGFDVIIGTVRPDFNDLSPEQISAWETRHTPGQPNGRVHAANLGIRASTYSAAGGFRPQVEHEDVDLVGWLQDYDARIVASENGEVLTSGRQVGKTPGGYARYLAEDLIPNEDTDAA